MILISKLQVYNLIDINFILKELNVKRTNTLIPLIYVLNDQRNEEDRKMVIGKKKRR